MRDKVIRILWLDPVDVESAIQRESALNPGLYYITRIWGDHETSLYIGKASRTIRERLIDHQKHWLPLYRGKLMVRIGLIQYPLNPDADIIDHAESALIFEHGDILTDNTDKRKTYSYSELYQIQNIGNIGMLKEKIRMHEHPDL